MQQARQASNDDTKSSAGDKYETTREMMQQEMDRNSKLLYEAGQQKIALQQLEHAAAKEAKNGSLVLTSAGNFYISISAGELKVGDQTFIAVSQASPIGRLFIGKQIGEELNFNGKSYLIKEIL